MISSSTDRLDRRCPGARSRSGWPAVRRVHRRRHAAGVHRHDACREQVDGVILAARSPPGEPISISPRPARRGRSPPSAIAKVSVPRARGRAGFSASSRCRGMPSVPPRYASSASWSMTTVVRSWCVRGSVVRASATISRVVLTSWMARRSASSCAGSRLGVDPCTCAGGHGPRDGWREAAQAAALPVPARDPGHPPGRAVASRTVAVDQLDQRHGIGDPDGRLLLLAVASSLVAGDPGAWWPRRDLGLQPPRVLDGRDPWCASSWSV